MNIAPSSRKLGLVTLVLALAGCGSSSPPPTETLPAAGAPAGGRVPAQTTVLTVTRGRAGHRPSVLVTATQLGKVATVAALFDSLHSVPKGVVNCPNIPVAPTVSFTFSARRRGPALARASMPADGPKGRCPGVTFKARGHAHEYLYAQPRLLREADRVLGLGMARD